MWLFLENIFTDGVAPEGGSPPPGLLSPKKVPPTFSAGLGENPTGVFNPVYTQRGVSPNPGQKAGSPVCFPASWETKVNRPKLFGRALVVTPLCRRAPGPRGKTPGGPPGEAKPPEPR